MQTYTLPRTPFAISFLALLATAVNGAPAASPAGHWTVQTADTRLTIGIGPNDELLIRELARPGTDWNWTSQASAFPLVSQVRQRDQPTTLRWRFVRGELKGAAPQTLTLTFTNEAPALSLISKWVAQPGPGPVRQTMFIRNDGADTVTLLEQETFDVRVQGPDNRTRLWYFNDDGSIPDKTGVYQQPLANGFTRSLTISEEQDYIPFVYVDAGGAHGLYFGWEWSIGRVALEATSSTEVRLRFGNRDDFRTDLAAGATFEVPPGFVGAYAGDVDDGGNRLRKHLFAHAMPTLLQTNTTFPRVQWNAFAPTGEKQGSWTPLERKYYPFIDDIAPLGFEEVVIDVGWWSSHGDPGHIITHATNWPGGMPAAAKYAHDRGLRFGLYDNEPEDLTTVEGIQERISDVTYLIKDLHADFYRSDSTAGPVLKGSHGKGRSHYVEDAGYWACKGFYEVIDTLHARLPGFLWECCSGGGRIKDFGMARRAGRIQNQDRYYPLDARQSFYDSSHVMHPMQLAALDGSWAEWQATGSVFEFRSSSMGAAYWHPDAPNGGNGGPVWSADQKEAIRKAVATYKTRVRPLIRAGTLFHIFPRPDDRVWDGIEYFDPETQRGVVYVFKPRSAVETEHVKLKGLAADTRYALSFEDGTNPPRSAPGQELMSTGVSITLEGTNVSELMFIEKAP